MDRYFLTVLDLGQSHHGHCLAYVHEDARCLK